MTELIDLFVAPRETTGIAYMITGSVAAMLYGEPRLTNDIDLVLELHEKDIGLLEKAFDEEYYYRPPAEVILVEQARRQWGHFNLLHLSSMLKADVYLIGSDPLHQWGMSHRQRVSLGSLEASFAPPEYVILRKLQFYQEGGSEKHLRDIKGMLAESFPEIDASFVSRQSKGLGLETTWQSLLSTAEG